jgi:hypothetical protein
MKEKILLFLCLGLLTPFTGFAQTKTVTNQDLEKFRQRRLNTEREYRENYERLGFPSPEELARESAEDSKQMEELSARLRQERLERERINIERQQIAAETARFYASTSTPDVNYGYPQSFYSGYGFYGFSNFGSRRYRRNYRRAPQYRATPVGIYLEPRRPVRIRTRTPGRRGRR